jgi:hypothetical protein
MKNSALFSATPASGSATRTPSATPSESATPAAGVSDDIVRRVAEARRRVADAQSKPKTIRTWRVYGCPKLQCSNRSSPSSRRAAKLKELLTIYSITAAVQPLTLCCHYDRTLQNSSHATFISAILRCLPLFETLL